MRIGRPMLRYVSIQQNAPRLHSSCSLPKSFSIIRDRVGRKPRFISSYETTLQSFEIGEQTYQRLMSSLSILNPSFHHQDQQNPHRHPPLRPRPAPH